MDRRETAARGFAAALLAGKWTPAELERSAEAFFGRSTKRSQTALIRRLLEQQPTAYPPSPAWLEAVFLGSSLFDRAARRRLRHPARVPSALDPAAFAPLPRFAGLDIPHFAAPAELAEWLGLSAGQLDWFADTRRQHCGAATSALQHYAYAFVPKASGPPRLIEAPKARMKDIQRRILRSILDAVPVHDRVHGFVAGRSCLSAARVHAFEALVVTVDLKDFFLTTPLRRVHGVFRSLGYPHDVARLLTGLCSSSTPRQIFEGQQHDWRSRKLFEAPHLPQGAPTSPALANLAAWRLDARLHGLAKSFDAAYTRYADDLAFSGDEGFARRAACFLAAIEEIARDESYALNARKTRLMGRGACQTVTGVVVNQHVNIRRSAYDRLKAILHNCAKNGPLAENRDSHEHFKAHLEGRVTWVETVNPARGRRLRLLFDAVRW